MTAPGTDQQPPQVVNSLMWQIGHGVGSGGQKMGVLALTQGALTVNLQVSIEDLERLRRVQVQGPAWPPRRAAP